VTGPSIEEIKQKIVQVIEVLNHTKTQRDELLKENARLSETNEHLKKANHTL
jgi:regulator of replication initiation timing